MISNGKGKKFWKYCSVKCQDLDYELQQIILHSPMPETGKPVMSGFSDIDRRRANTITDFAKELEKIPLVNS